MITEIRIRISVITYEVVAKKMQASFNSCHEVTTVMNYENIFEKMHGGIHMRPFYFRLARATFI